MNKNWVEAVSFDGTSPDGLASHSSSVTFGDSILAHVVQLDQNILLGEDDTIHVHHDAQKAAVGQV